MATEKRIPRVRIHEDNFSDVIKKFPLSKEWEDDPFWEVFFIEVINEKDEVIALFFLYYPLRRNEFRNVLEFAKYYDSLGDRQWEEEDLQEAMEQAGVATEEEYWRFEANLGYIQYGDKSENSRFGIAARGIISYGRLKYPLGLNDEDRNNYAGDPTYYFFGETNWYTELVQDHENYSDDLIDFINYALIESKVKESAANINTLFPNFDIRGFIYSDIEILNGIADNLFTKGNIDQFIDYANSDGKTEIITFLLDYKNKHFPANESSLQLNHDN
jgi:hypothetical protein